MNSQSINPEPSPIPDTNADHLHVLALANELTRRAKNQMMLGGALVAGGIILTLVTYAGAKPGGQYAIFWGLILAGVIRFATAAKKLANAREDAVNCYQNQLPARLPGHRSVESSTTPIPNPPLRTPAAHQDRRVNVPRSNPSLKPLANNGSSAACAVCGSFAGRHDAWCSRFAG